MSELGGDDLSEEDIELDDDAGGERQDVSDDNDDLDTDPNDPFDPSAGRRQQEPDDRVSHTRGREQQREPKRPLPKRSEVKADRKGNLLDKDGKIVARAGREARIYQSRERVRRDLSRVTSEHARVSDQLRRLAGAARGLHDKVKSYEAADAKLKEFGITPQEQLTAMQMFVELRDNAPQAIRRIMARAAASGVDLTSLGENGNVGLDAKTLADIVKGEVSKLVEPLKARSDQQAQREEEQSRRNQAQADVDAEVQGFFERNPDAKQYFPVFQRVLANPAFANLSLGEIYSRILQHPNLTRDSSRQRSRTPNGMPRGRGTIPQGGRNSKIADPNTSYEAILDSVLTEHGMPRQQRV